jgi:ribosome-associated translation inhibitor RaiA
MDKNMEIIKVEQLPVIAERLHEIKAEIEEEAKSLMALEVNDDTLTAVKTARANFNKQFNELEDKRKAVKNAIMKPYNDFETVYKECVTEPIKTALTAIDGKIAAITVKRTEDKLVKAKAYYESLAGKMGIEWLEFERLGIKVNASDSDSKIYGAIDEAVDKICADVKLIGMNEHSDEVLFEFKKHLNAIRATVDVMERHKALDKVEANSAVPTEPAMTEDDILDAVMADMGVKEVPKMVVFEKPKKEYRFKFYLDEDEYIKFCEINKIFDFEEE